MNEIAWHMYTSVDCASRVTGSSVSLAVEILRKNDNGEGKRSLRNGMWHGLRKDIIMGNVKYGKWRKETNKTEKHLCRASFWRQFEWAAALQVHLLLLAQTNKAEQKVAIRFTNT